MWPFSLFKRKEQETQEQEIQEQYYGGDNYYERDMEIIISKLDLVNARLENLNGRLERIEEFIKQIR